MDKNKTFYTAVHGSAAPMVAGVAGLVWTAAPHLTREEVVGIITDTLTEGRLNAEAAVKEAMKRAEAFSVSGSGPKD